MQQFQILCMYLWLQPRPKNSVIGCYFFSCGSVYVNNILFTSNFFLNLFRLKVFQPVY